MISLVVMSFPPLFSRGFVRVRGGSPSSGRKEGQRTNTCANVFGVDGSRRIPGSICASWNRTVSLKSTYHPWIGPSPFVTILLVAPMHCSPCSPRKRIGTDRTHLSNPRYLQNGNILAARAFLTHFVSQLSTTRPNLMSSFAPSPIAVGKTQGGQPDEIVLTKDPIVNWAQLAVRTCQRAQGDRNKAMREAWVRLCGTYQSRGGLLASKETRKVSTMRKHYALRRATVAVSDAVKCGFGALLNSTLLMVCSLGVFTPC